jgi:hypothetical protein
MSEPLVIIDTSEVLEGRLEELKTAIKELAEFVDTNESRPIAYHFYLDEGCRHMTVIQVHPDSASMEAHTKLGGAAFSRFVGLISLSTMDVYGQPSDELLALLQHKVQMLGGAHIAVHDFQAGFSRFGVR